MTIKSKLTLNVVIVLVIIVIVSTTNIIGMGFVKNKLQDLTERSTPYQMATVEFQKAIQKLASDLSKVSSSGNSKEYEVYRAETDKSIASLKEAQAALENLSGGAKIHLGITGLTSELISITGDRLKAESDAEDAKNNIVQNLRKSSEKLDVLNKQVASIQLNRTAAFTSSSTEMKEITAKLKNIQLLLLQLKDLQFLIAEIDLIQEKKKILILNGKLSTLLAKMLQNDYLKVSKKFSDDIKAMSEKMPELIKVKTSLLGAPEVKADYDQLRKNISEDLSTLSILVEQEAASAADYYKSDNEKQEASLLYMSIANNILGSNSELLSLGLEVNGLTMMLFMAASNKEIDGIGEKINKAFGMMDIVAKNLEKGLKKIGAKDEMLLLNHAMQAVNLSRGLLFASDGIISKVHRKINMREKALRVTEELRKIVVEQDRKGKETVIIARGEQQNAIASVNKVVHTGTILLVIISTGAVVFGIAFGMWIYKSISKPLAELVAVSDDVTQGNLSVNINVSAAADEIGTVKSSMSKMVSTLREIAENIKSATESLSVSSEELSATATSLNDDSQQQAAQVDMSVSAITEMSQTTTDVANNVLLTSEAAQNMKQIAVHGRGAMNDSAEELRKFADIVSESTAKVESLSRKSEAINNIVTMIKDIANQTNLLALNAAIEAARAGEQGRGFSVVADSVRQLAERTTLATDDVTKMVKAMKEEIAESVSYMQGEKESITVVLAHVDRTKKSIGEIASCVERVTDMVQRIAASTEQQSSSAEGVSQNMENIALVTKHLSASTGEIKHASVNLSELATKLNTITAWFKVE